MKRLTDDSVRAYHDTGYLSPIPVLTAVEAAMIRRNSKRSRPARAPWPANSGRNPTSFTWLNDLIRHERILDAVEDVIGPDILCWGTSFFIKEPHNHAFVSWHQDLTYWGLEPPDIVTAWIALSDSTTENGAMRVVPKTHTMAQVPHRDTFRSDNLLSRGQEVLVDVDPSQAVTLTLKAGEMSLHHVRLIHGSDPNPSDTRRIGFAIRYLPTYVRQVAGSHDWATLVRGVDRHGNFELEQRPDADMSESAQAYHAAVVGGHSKILMRDTGRAMRA